MTAPRAPFADRLALARKLIARRTSRPPVHVTDQLGAAGREARQVHDRIGGVLPILAPDRDWRQRIDEEPSDGVRAHLAAAVMGCLGDVCCYLHKLGPQPAFALLPLRQVACVRCAGTARRPVTAPDGCDVCGAREVITFSPFACYLGPAIVTGDACGSCARTLGIRVAEVAS
jgi:hypothetical protein